MSVVSYISLFDDICQRSALLTANLARSFTRPRGLWQCSLVRNDYVSKWRRMITQSMTTTIHFLTLIFACLIFRSLCNHLPLTHQPVVRINFVLRWTSLVRDLFRVVIIWECLSTTVFTLNRSDDVTGRIWGIWRCDRDVVCFDAVSSTFPSLPGLVEMYLPRVCDVLQASGRHETHTRRAWENIVVLTDRVKLQRATWRRTNPHAFCFANLGFPFSM